MLNNYGDILDLEDVCEILHIGKNTAYRLIRRKAIPAFKVGRVYKIPRKAVENYILSEAHMQ